MRWPAYLAGLWAEEREWIGRPVSYPVGGCVPWVPLHLPEWMAYMTDALAGIPEVEQPVYLDVGCGPATKVRLASALFGLTAWGIEISPELYGAAAERCRGAVGVGVEQADALTWEGYGEFDVISVYRVSSSRQRELEERIRDQMKPGAVLMLVSGISQPREDWGWHVLAEEWGESHGVWQKR